MNTSQAKQTSVDFPRSDIGQFMVGVGAVIEHEPSGDILITYRSKADFQIGVWELVYGRLDNHEEIDTGLRREINEELGISDVEIQKLLRVWHFYRGEKSETTEIYGFTFHCTVQSRDITLNDEHSAFEWVKPEVALERIQVTGIKQDLENFLLYKQQKLTAVALSTVSETQTFI